MLAKVYLFTTLFAVVLLLRVCDGSIGVSLSKALDRSGWEALVATAPAISAGAVHILFFNGSINQHAPSTIRAGWNANIRDISVYMHPCMNTSVYSVQNKVPCGTVEEQFESILDTMTNNNIDFRQYLTSGMALSPNSTSAAPTRQPTQSPSVSSARPVLQRLFVCLEDEVPNRYMSNNHGENVRYLLELHQLAIAHGIQLGVYTTKNDWLNTMTMPHPSIAKVLVYPTNVDNTEYNAINPFSDLPLWTPRFDSVNSMAFFAPFGNWERVFMKEISGSTTALHRIGSDRVGMTYTDDNVASQYYDNQILEYIVI